MQNINEFDKIRRDYISNKRIRKLVINELVNNGKIARRDASLVFSYQIGIEDFDPAVLCLIYQTILRFDSDAGRPTDTYFFSRQEIDNAASLLKRETIEGFPIIFSNVMKISPKQEYLICMSAQQIYDMSMNKVIRIRPDMARESEIIYNKNEAILCVSYDPDKVDEITDNFLCGSQHPNALRFHLNVDIDGDSYEFNEKSHELTIYKGSLANIDGNHRISGLVNAIAKNRHIASQYYFPVILSIGTPEMARSIIVQEEKRTPIDVEHLDSYKCQEGNRIVALLKNYDELEQAFGFCTTSKQHRAGGGFFVEHIMADAINKHFKLRKMLTSSQRKEYAQYLCDIFVTFYNYVDEMYPNYIKEYAQHGDYAMSDEYTVHGLIYMAAKLRDQPDCFDLFTQWLSKMNFHKKSNHRFLYGEKRIMHFVTSYEEEL